MTREELLTQLGEKGYSIQDAIVAAYNLGIEDALNKWIENNYDDIGFESAARELKIK